MHLGVHLAVMALTLGLCGTALAAEKLEVPVTKTMINQISNVVYEQVPSRGYANVAMRMDILQPMNKEPKPVILYVPGGGFINANKDQSVQQRMALAEAGFVVASMEYRVAPVVKMPAPLEDVKSAIRYLKANSTKFGINPQKVGLLGGSAGGYLVAMGGVTGNTKAFDKGDNLNQSSKVQAVVDLYGVSDLTKIGADFGPANEKLHESSGATEALWVNGSGVFGGKDGGVTVDLAALKDAQIFTYIDGKEPPFLLMYGTKDTVVSPSQSEILYKALKEKGNDATIYAVEGAKHGGEYWVQPQVVNIIVDFFKKHLK